MSTRITHKPISSFGGAEVSGIDLSESVGNDARADLLRIFDENHILLFRDQHLQPEDQIRALGIFGNVIDENADGIRHTYVSNVRPDGLLGTRGLPFHSDFSFLKHPAQLLSLYGAEIEGEPEPTTYVNTARACAHLPADLRRKLEGLTAMHVHDYSVDGGRNPDHGRVRLLELPVMPPYATHPRASYPMIVKLPRTGTPVLRVSQFHTSHVEGMSSADSETIMQDLFARLYSDDNMYAHRWKQGDLVVWNNIAIQHGRKPFQGPAKAARRTLCRVVVMDKTVPEIMEGVTYNSTGGFKVAPAMV
jgi:taurine dioxygenase